MQQFISEEFLIYTIFSQSLAKDCSVQLCSSHSQAKVHQHKRHAYTFVFHLLKQNKKKATN